MKLKIASVTNCPLDPTLGSGKTVVAWSQGFRSLGHHVEVLAPDRFYAPWPGGKGRQLKMRLDALKLKRALLEGKFHAVEFYGAEFGWLVGQLARIRRRDRPMLVAHTNGLELLAREMAGIRTEEPQGVGLKNFVRKLIDPWVRRCDEKALTHVDAFAAICQADVNYVLANSFQPEERCAVVEPGIDGAYLNAPWDRSKKQWLVTLGSWTPRKDTTTIVRVISGLLESDVELQYHVLGAAGAKASIQLAFPAHLRNRLIVHPRLAETEMVEVLAQAKVLLFPSLYEGFGMATTEAMACGCAVVVTPTGFGASIQDGQDGFVCDFRDADAMLNRIAELLRNEALRVRLAAAGRLRVEGMTWERQVGKLERTYRDWLNLRDVAGASVMPSNIKR